MNIFKRYLAMFLVICMLVSALPVTALAAETDSTEESTVEPLADTLPTPGHMATKPADGATLGEPFPDEDGKEPGGSSSFRIPAMVTLSDGTLVAAADARWNTTYDGGGLDTIVARSSSNGAKWYYTFANYLGDKGNVYNGSQSTAFIDPALAVTSSDTIYMLVDLYPYGVALNGDGTQTAPSTAVGFNDAGQLLLSNDSHASYGCYLDGNTIRTTNGDAVDGYYVDAYFNLYTVADGTKTYASNLFFADSPFKVVRTGYLYLTKSTDKGATWSAPILLDIDRASATEKVTLVGPGRGLVTKNGTIVFPVYSYHGDNSAASNTQRMSFVYSTDGVNWSRSAELNYNWASEAAVVELNDGTLRFFFRNGTTNLCYVDYKDGWKTPVTMTAIDTNSNCQISAITYSKTIGGKQVILVSCPTGSNSAGDNQSGASYRLNGKIFAFTVEADGSLAKAGEVSVTSNNAQFMYSCLTELNNSTVGILYEDKENAWGAGDSCYYTMSYGTYDPAADMGLTFDSVVSGSAAQNIDVILMVGETYSGTVSGAALTGSNTDTTIAAATWTGSDAVKSITEISSTDGLEDGKQYLIVNKNTGDILSDIGLYLNGTWGYKSGLKTEGKLDAGSQELWTIKPAPNNSGYYVMQGGMYLAFAGYYATMETTPTALTLNHTDSGWTLYDGTTYGELNASDNKYYLSDGVPDYDGAAFGLKTVGDTGHWAIHEVAETSSAQTAVTITGNKAGTTTAVVGNTTYNITVVENVVDVVLEVGETSQTYSDDTGNYQDNANNVAPDAQIATMEVVGETVQGNTSVQEATSVADGDSYYIRTSNNTYLTADATETSDVTKAVKWVFTKSPYSGYFLSFGDKYLTYSNGSFSVRDSESTFYPQGGSLRFYIWGTGYVTVGTAVDITGTTSTHNTAITFEGVAPGKTYAVVGTTQYNITVTPGERTVDIELEVGETFTYTDTTGNYVGTAYTQPDGAYANMTVTGSSAATRTSVTAIESGKRYLIVNRNSGEILTDTAVTVSGKWGGRDGLATIQETAAQGLEWWTITESGGKYTLVQKGKYLGVAGFVAQMNDTETLLTLTYTADGWTIYDNTTWASLGHGQADYYLSDSVGDNYSGSAQGTSDTNNGARYWDIIEVPHTDVSFTGVAPTTTPTTAKVGHTTYNITVVAQEVDDEVENTATDIWTVDPEIQAQRITDATVTNTGYTDASWKTYADALAAAQAKLAEVTDVAYTSKAAAQDALDELKDLTDALETAKAALVPGKPITVHYWRPGAAAAALSETIYVPANAVSYELEPTKTVDGVAYTLSTTTLSMTGNVSEFNVHLLKEYETASGIVGGTNLDGTQVQARPVTEMTVTVGMEYDLNVADILASGQTIEWSTSNAAVATVDANGKVTAVAEGTAAITAAIKNGDTVVRTYTMPITVLPAAGDVDKRTVAMYVDNIDNTTVTCVLHANGNKWSFDVAEGELIYGQFQMTGNTSTSTGADSVTGLTFFGNPDDRHALVSMSSTNSFAQYYPLHDADGKVVQDEDGTPLDHGDGLPYYADKDSGAAKWLAIGLSGNPSDNVIDNTVWKNQIVAMAKDYADKGYDGAQGFTRRTTEGNINSNLSFASDPMPELTKTVDGVLPTGGKFDNYQRYVEGMVAAVDEVVFFKITVTLKRPAIWAMNADGTIVTDSDGKQKGAITYAEAILADIALEDSETDFMDAYFYTKEEYQSDGLWDGQFTDGRVNEKDITDQLNAYWADGEEVRVLDYYLVYKIQSKDVPKFNIRNEASLTHKYTSVYSSGALNNTADAQADITVIGVAMDNVVIDFGQTFVYEGLTNRHLKGVYVNGTNDNTDITQCKATANYGTVTVTRVQKTDADGNGLTEGEGDKVYPQYEYTVTYTPHSILQAPDMVRLYGVGEGGKEKVINGFIVYPATTVYYEEGFAFPAITSPITNSNDTTLKYPDMTSGSWDLDNSATASVNQTFEKLGRTEINGNVYTIHSDKQNPYGFDPVYNSDTAPNGSYAMSNTPGDRTRFTFTGDGIQIFANCTETPASGYVSVEIREATAPYKIVRLAMVNTKVLAGSTPATEGQTGDMDGLPVVSLVNVQGMEHGTYVVTITKVMDAKSVYIDGIRIFNTVESLADSSPFTIDLEDQPEFYELRDAVLHAVGAKDETSVDYAGKTLAEQIYNAANGASALITDESVDYANSNTVQDLLDKGPKNELFLYAGQTLTFKVTTKRTMQVGLKAPRGATTASVTVNNGAAVAHQVSSSVDMFYNVVKDPAQSNTEYLVSITNTGSDILSVTLLKICDDPDAAFAQLTLEDIENILRDPITIVSQPADTEVKMGERYNVEVIAKGEGLKYTWYFRNAGSATYHQSSVRDNTYDDVMTPARAGREVYCVITDALGNSVTTNTAKITAIPDVSLEILQQPVDQAVRMGERYNAEVTAVGDGLQYRWFFRNQGSDVFSASGVRDNTYDDVMTAARAGREVYCVITDAYGNSVTTNTVRLTVLPETLEILQQPADSAAKLGEKYMVEVIAQGDGLRYQWFYRNAGSAEFVVSGVRDNTYDDVMTAARAGREVYCVITDAYGNQVTTETVKLIALPSQTLEILQQPADSAAKLGEKYMVEVIAQGDGLHYQWFYRNAGSTEFVVSGVRDNTYDDVMTAARAGREVYCVITDAFGNQVTTETVKLIALPSQTLEILQQPVDSAAKLGEKYMVEVIARGDGLRYQWYFRNKGQSVFQVSGVRDNTYDDVMTAARAGREVYCVITDAFGNSVTTATVKLICIEGDT